MEGHDHGPGSLPPSLLTGHFSHVDEADSTREDDIKSVGPIFILEDPRVWSQHNWGSKLGK